MNLRGGGALVKEGSKTCIRSRGQWSKRPAPAHGQSGCPAPLGRMSGEGEPPFAVLDYEPSRYFKEREKTDGVPRDEFIASLDAKLKRLEEEEGRGKKSKKRSSSLDSRPMFITTVKTGIFLDPPPELAALLGYNLTRSQVSSGSTSNKSSEELMYSYSSQPRVLNNKLRPKVSNEKLQQVNMEKQKNRNNRAKRDTAAQEANLSKSNITNNFNSTNTNNNNNNNKNSNTNNSKKKEDIHFGNIMYDRRVVRGPAFLQHPVPTATGGESPAARQAEARRRMMARRRAQSQKVRALKYRLGSPPQAEGRKNMSLQTHDYLEELYELTKSVETQTICESEERPSSPVFEPASSGVEAGVQVLPEELFHFDEEVKPLLEVLVGKTVEQSLEEVFEEDELAALKAQHRELRERREAELAEQQRELEAERRRQAEIDARLMEEAEGASLEKEAEGRVAAAVLSTGYIVDLLPSVMQGLKDAGYLYEEIKDDMGGEFMDWLIKEVKTEMQRMVENRDLLTEMLREILETRADLYRALGERAAAKRGATDEEDLTPSEATTVVEGEGSSGVGEEVVSVEGSGEVPAGEPVNVQ